MARCEVGYVGKGRYYKGMAEPNDDNESGTQSIMEAMDQSLSENINVIPGPVECPPIPMKIILQIWCKISHQESTVAISLPHGASIMKTSS